MTDPTATIDSTIAHLRRFNVFDALRSAESELRHSNAVSASGLIASYEATGLTRTDHF